MKKVILYSLISLFFLACNKKEDVIPKNTEPENTEANQRKRRKPNPNTPFYRLRLTRWKITTPQRRSKKDKRAKEYIGNSFKTVSNRYFKMVGNYAQFMAPVQGATTSGSRNPRSELREMHTNLVSNMGWNTHAVTRSLNLKGRIVEVPSSGRLVFGQIHDGRNDVALLEFRRTKGNKGQLYLVLNRKKYYLTHNYTMGHNFAVKLLVRNKRLIVQYNYKTIRMYFHPHTKKWVYSLPVPYRTRAYFKAGCYIQGTNSKSRGKGRVQLSAIAISNK